MNRRVRRDLASGEAFAGTLPRLHRFIQARDLSSSCVRTVRGTWGRYFGEIRPAKILASHWGIARRRKKRKPLSKRKKELRLPSVY